MAVKQRIKSKLGARECKRIEKKMSDQRDEIRNKLEIVEIILKNQINCKLSFASAKSSPMQNLAVKDSQKFT